MGVYYQTENLPAFRNPVITIGTFDGVHKGHQKILSAVKNKALQTDGESIVITFHPHPRKLLFPDQQLQLLTPLEEKILLLQEEGIHHIVVVPFTKAFSALSAKEYVAEFLVAQFHPQCIVIGYDHHFGNDRSGNIELLHSLKNELNFEVEELPAQLIQEAAISSTKIRKSLSDGDVQAAAEMLGRNYSLQGTVVKGAQLGRTIGYPTANILPHSEDQLIPADGVYAVKVLHENDWLDGMMNIGFKPSVSSAKMRTLEVHLFDFDADIYNHSLEIHFIKRLRAEQKFDSLQSLQNQLEKDAMAAKAALEVNKVK